MTTTRPNNIGTQLLCSITFSFSVFLSTLAGIYIQKKKSNIREIDNTKIVSLLKQLLNSKNRLQLIKKEKPKS